MNHERKPRIDRLIHSLGGLKLTFLLLVLLGGLVAQRAIIAQKFIYTENIPWFLELLNALGLDSPETLQVPFYLVLGLFAVNLGLSSLRMARRIGARQRGMAFLRNEEAVRALPVSEVFSAPTDSGEYLVAFFKKNRFRIAVEDTGTGEARMHASRHGFGYWGVLFFHLMFLVLLVGALLSVLTRYAGSFRISPGEMFVEQRESYRNVTDAPVLFGGDRLFRLRLEEMQLSYWRPWEGKEIASTVRVFGSDGAFLGHKRIAVNSPLSIGDMNIYQGGDRGFVAEIEAVDPVGTKARGSLAFRMPKKPGQDLVSRATLPGTTMELEFRLFTEQLGKIEGLEELGAQHMATLMKVATVQEQQATFRGVVFLGGTLAIEGITLRLLGLKPYTSFVAVRDYGVPVIFGGFAVLVIGLVITYFWVPEHYWAVIRREQDKDLVVIGAATEKFKESFRARFESEMNEIREELEKR